MLYREPKIVPDSDINSRWLTPGLSRPQNVCPLRDGEKDPGRFTYSRCDHEGSITGSLQRYIIYCYPPRVKDTPDSTAAEPSSDSNSSDASGKPSKMPFATVGMCGPNEICAPGNGMGSHYDRKRMRANPDAQVAQCVSQSYYVELAQASGAGEVSSLQLEGEKVSMVFSAADAKTPLKVQEMDWSAGELGLTTTATKTYGGQGSRCMDCVDLASGNFEAGTDSLKTQATVLTTAGVAILWITIMSG